MARTILADPRYPDFVARYHADPLRFAVEVCGMQPSADQEALLMELIPRNAKVSVVSGTGTGKTATFARIALWHLLCCPIAFVEGKVEIGSNTYIGAPVIQQVADGIWKEMNDAVLAIANGPHKWLLHYFTVTKTRVYVNGYSDQWFVGQVAFRKGEAVSIAGKHRYWQLIIIDEAAGVSDDHFNVVEGTQTSPGNRTLLASQGARNTGHFYDTHHSLSVEKGGSWVSLRFNSERSPFVTEEWLQQREVESGGRHTVEYQVRVLGLFAEDTSNVLLARAEVERVFELGDTPLIGEDENYGVVILSDVAMGEYRDDSVIVLAKIIGHGDFGPEARRVEFYEIPLADNSKNEIDLAGDLVNQQARLDSATMYVDNGGIGAAVCKLIERSGGIVERVDWGKPCFSKAYQQRYFNLRACANVRLRDAIRQGRVRFPKGLSRRLREKIIDQGSRLPYHFTEAGGLRYVMMKKEDMAKEGIKSPDVWDCFAFAFLESLTYVPGSGRSGRTDREGAVATAVERLRAARAAMRQELGAEGPDEEGEEGAGIPEAAG